MTLSNWKCQFLYKNKEGRQLPYEVSPVRSPFLYQFSYAKFRIIIGNQNINDTPNTSIAHNLNRCVTGVHIFTLTYLKDKNNKWYCETGLTVIFFRTPRQRRDILKSDMKNYRFSWYYIRLQNSRSEYDLGVAQIQLRSNITRLWRI